MIYIERDTEREKDRDRDKNREGGGNEGREGGGMGGSRGGQYSHLLDVADFELVGDDFLDEARLVLQLFELATDLRGCRCRCESECVSA